jgi:hypothetical protein
VCDAHGDAFNLWKVVATKIFVHNELEEKMEAKDQNMIKMKDEMDFFILIERKLEQEGFRVLETLPPDRNRKDKSESFFTTRSTSRFAY